MKANELMIGDWANYKSPTSGELRPIKIKNIYGCEFNCEVEYWEIISGKSISDLYPLELTEEILVKNGFELGEEIGEVGVHIYRHTVYKTDNFSLRVYNDNTFHFASIKLTYVHQLQHLLRLCNVQKEIEL